jgi:hypothetical protein
VPEEIHQEAVHHPVLAPPQGLSVQLGQATVKVGSISRVAVTFRKALEAGWQSFSKTSFQSLTSHALADLP